MTRYASGAIMKRGQLLPAKASGAETASTTGPAFEAGAAAVGHVEVNVTAASGTSPTLLVVIEGSNDLTNWYTLAQVGSNGGALGGAAAAPSNITGTGIYRAAVVLAQFVRYRSVIGGTTPSFTYGVNIEANDTTPGG